MSDQRDPAAPRDDYVSILADAKRIVRASVLYRRFIDGTPLENDIAVWMADFALDIVREHASFMREAALAPAVTIELARQANALAEVARPDEVEP